MYHALFTKKLRIMTRYADIHCHSTFSDGTCSPQDLVDKACEAGLRGLSITDHDNIKAYDTVRDYAQEKELHLIPGVEFSAMHKDTNVHVLGYSFITTHPTLSTFCHKHILQRRDRNTLILDKLKKYGIHIEEQEIFDIHKLTNDSSEDEAPVGRPHIARVMVEKGYVSSVNEAFNKYIAEGKKCYSAGRRSSVEEAIDAIHQAHGVAILAHPHLLDNKSITGDLLAMDFDGLEAYYAHLPYAQEKIWIERAQKKGWIVTGGSDFHGSIKPNISLGCSWVPQETFRHLQNHFLQALDDRNSNI
jgi:3',5'-nucleoside bisphosphate phosphatase